MTLLRTEKLSIGVDEVRALVGRANLSPVMGRYQIVVVEDAATLARCAAAERARVPRWAAPTAGRIPP